MLNSTRNLKHFLVTTFTISFLLLISQSLLAQRPYGIIYSDNIKGDFEIIGNTLMSEYSINAGDTVYSAATTDNTTGNNGRNLQFVDIDDDPSTPNSSKASLTIPDFSTILFARLYWAGSVDNTQIDLTDPANRSIKIKHTDVNDEPYTTFVANNVDMAVTTTTTQYQAYADILPWITTGLRSNGEYTVGGIAATPGDQGTYGSYAGWAIVIAYQNDGMVYQSVRIYDGYTQVYNAAGNTTVDVALTGLDVPDGSPTARMGALVWEGDGAITGDSLLINGTAFSDVLNPIDNDWNGTISKNGSLVHSKYPDLQNQMAVDIDQFDASSYVVPNSNTANLSFKTSTDNYLPGVMAFSVVMTTPSVSLDKLVKDSSNNDYAGPNELLTYTLVGQGIGIGNVNKAVLKDTLPTSVTYEPGTLEIVSSPGGIAGAKTDATGDDQAEAEDYNGTKIVTFRAGTGADATDGGTLASGESFTVIFKARVNPPPPKIPVITNTARLSATNDAGDTTFTDDGTATINPDTLLPVTLINFSGVIRNNQAVLGWTTTNEINNKGFDVERSIDGRNFSAIGFVKAAGNVAAQNNYTYTDIKVNPGDNYYRLRQVDLDGSSRYSAIIQLKSLGAFGWRVYPNPVANEGWLQLQLTENSKVAIQVIASNGKTIQAIDKGTLSAGTYSIPLSIERAAKGTYFVKLIVGNKTYTQTINK